MHKIKIIVVIKNIFGDEITGITILHRHILKQGDGVVIWMDMKFYRFNKFFHYLLRKNVVLPFRRLIPYLSAKVSQLTWLAEKWSGEPTFGKVILPLHA